MASVRPAPAIARLMPSHALLELGDDAVPFARRRRGRNATSRCVSMRRHALAGQGAQHDRLRPAVALARAGAARRRSASMSLPSISLRLPAEGAPFVGDRLHVEHDRAVGLDAVAVDQRHQVVEPEMRRPTSPPPRSSPPASRRRTVRRRRAPSSRRAAGRAPCRPPGRARGRASRRSSRRRAWCRASTSPAGCRRRRR